MTSIDDELDKFYPGCGVNPDSKRRKEGYVCSCEKGSPNPGYVIRVPSLHEKHCHVRKKLAKESFEAGVTLNN